MPSDRTIDGVDQLDLLLGKKEASNREGFPCYVAYTLHPVKWRNWKGHFVWQEGARRSLVAPPRRLAVPEPAHWPDLGPALKRAELPPISLYEGTKHSFATDAIRRGVPERHLQRFLGHASLVSTRRYARLADNAMLEVLRPRYEVERQASDKGPRNKAEQNQSVRRGPSWIRTRRDSKKRK